jgi:uncharacterized protein (TIGR00730 family)
MKNICVYLGSNPGNRVEYKESVLRLGDVLVQNNIDLVYGGSKIGLMGELSNQVLKKNGKVTGVMPKNLFPESVVNNQLTKLIYVEDMHERKKKMADLSDGFIALPGGIGTFEELFEILSWAQLGIHKKPIGLLNVEGFFDPVITLLQNTIKEGFMKASNLKLLLVSSNPAELISMMKAYVPPVMEQKWNDLKI